jgi:tetratricopeptide (TPR) repeat protein
MALQVSPINPTARFAVAQLERQQSSTTVSIRSLGLSRDVLCLAVSARRLLAAGRKEAALKLYGQSLSIAVTGASFRAPPVRFSDDPGVPRYLLPGEERVREIVREMAATNEWTFAEWSAVIPDSALVCLAAARLVREQGRSEAEALLERILSQRPKPAARGIPGAVTLAARAEAFALSSRWREAEEEYRQAIDLVDDDTIKRSWWFNLADIAFRLDDDNQRQAALRAAAAVAASDDITRRSAAIQRANRRPPDPRSMGVKAN